MEPGNITVHHPSQPDDGPQVTWDVILDDKFNVQMVQKITSHGDVCSIVEATVQDLAKEYVDTIYGASNDHGQYVHPAFGPSQQLMILMCDLFGSITAQEAISWELASRKTSK